MAKFANFLRWMFGAAFVVSIFLHGSYKPFIPYFGWAASIFVISIILLFATDAITNTSSEKLDTIFFIISLLALLAIGVILGAVIVTELFNIQSAACLILAVLFDVIQDIYKNEVWR